MKFYESSAPNCRPVCLSRLVVIYLGMRVNALFGLKTIIGFGPRIESAVKQRPNGLLLHEPIIYSISHARRHAPVLARFRFTETVAAVRAAYALVERIFT